MINVNQATAKEIDPTAGVTAAAITSRRTVTTGRKTEAAG
jgi:hypothetical protein